MIYRLLLVIFGMLPERLQETAEWLLSMKTTLGVSVAALDEHGRVLLFQHRYQPAGSWQLPGGHAHLGESPDCALMRELSEEGGALVELGPIIHVHVSPRWPARTTLYYVATLRQPPERVTSEVTGWRLWPVGDLPPQMKPHHRSVILQAAAHAGLTAENA